jgi:hypothetical protein
MILMKALRYVVAVEVALCFALPAYFLFWGVLTLPFWLLGTSSGAWFSAVHALSTIGGCLGLWALFKTLRYYLPSRPTRQPKWGLVLPLTTAGLAAIWY